VLRIYERSGRPILASGTAHCVFSCFCNLWRRMTYHTGNPEFSKALLNHRPLSRLTSCARSAMCWEAEMIPSRSNPRPRSIGENCNGSGRMFHRVYAFDLGNKFSVFTCRTDGSPLLYPEVHLCFGPPMKLGSTCVPPFVCVSDRIYRD